MIQREWLSHRLYGGVLLSGLGFYALALFCFAFVLGHDMKSLQQLAPPLFWLLATLTTLFSTPLLLKRDFQAGVLDEIFLHPAPLSLFLFQKCLIQTLTLGIPLIGLGIIFSPLYALPLQQTFWLSLTLFLGFPALASLGILGGLLTLQARGGSALVSLLILPLALPLVLLGLSILDMNQFGIDSFPSFCLFISVSLVLTILSLGAGTWALRIAVES